MSSRFLLLLLTITPVQAGEHTVQTKPFRIEQRFAAAALPTEPPSLRLDPESWEDYVIDSIVDHGAKVKAGDPVVRFDREDYENRGIDLKQSIANKELELANLRLERKKLEEEVKLQLGKARSEMEIAEEDLAYFEETGRPAEEASIGELVKQYEFSLEAEKEELKQLRQMYEEDDLTEQTEEIILDRQKFSVASAEFRLNESKREAERKRTLDLPRKAEQLARTVREKRIALEKAEENLPRGIQIAAVAIKTKEIELEREKLELERLEKDAGRFVWKAPTDGIVFHGEIEKDGWTLGDLAKVLRKGGKVPLRRQLVSVISEDASLHLGARVGTGIARALKDTTKIRVILPGREDLEVTGQLRSLEEIPGAKGNHGVTVEVEWPAEAEMAPGTEAECAAVIYENAEALVIPAKALSLGQEGKWGVEAKLADGQAERRPVERGRTTEKEVEIRSGLEPGQVIVVPD